MKGVIRLGDPTTHGGEVKSASTRHIVMGQPVACVGDSVSCPAHGEVVIKEGDPNMRIDSVAVALDGHEVSCGAKLISTVPTSGRR